MERVNSEEYPNCVIGFHTQEFRPDKPQLERPLKCVSVDAWLGFGFYFWVNLDFAKHWGEDFKKNYKGRNNGSYDVYQAYIDTSNCINATFDENGYNFFVRCIEVAINKLTQNNRTLNIAQVNRFLMENFWSKNNIKGIIYDDLPRNREDKDRYYSTINIKDQTFFYYKKRIQIVVFDLEPVKHFELHLDEQQ
jgi:hypothetical protein